MKKNKHGIIKESKGTKPSCWRCCYEDEPFSHPACVDCRDNQLLSSREYYERPVENE